MSDNLAPMSPGAYLRKRREAAGLDLALVAAGLAALPWAVPRPANAEIAALEQRLAQAEADHDNLTIAQAELLRNLFTFDLGVYEALLLHHHGAAGFDIGMPHLCRGCACSWHDACVTDHGPCGWTDRDADLCTACDRQPAPAKAGGVERQIRPAQPVMEGIPA